MATKKKDGRIPRTRTVKQRREEMYIFAELCYWLVRDDLEEATGRKWVDIPWSTVAAHCGCAPQTLKRLWDRDTRWPRHDTLQKLADSTGMGVLLLNMTAANAAKTQKKERLRLVA